MPGLESKGGATRLIHLVLGMGLRNLCERLKSPSSQRAGVPLAFWGCSASDTLLNVRFSPAG